jgi:hypothetical protein
MNTPNSYYYDDYYDELEWMDNASTFDWIKFYLAIGIMMIILYPICAFQKVKELITGLFKHN